MYRKERQPSRVEHREGMISAQRVFNTWRLVISVLVDIWAEGHSQQAGTAALSHAQSFPAPAAARRCWSSMPAPVTRIQGPPRITRSLAPCSLTSWRTFESSAPGWSQSAFMPSSSASCTILSCAGQGE